MSTQMPVGRKFALTSGALIALTVVLGATTLVGLASIGARTKTLSTDALDGITATGKMESALLEMRGDILKHIGASEPGQMAPLESHIESLKQEIATNLASVGATVFDEREGEIVRRIQPALERYYQLWSQVLPLSRASKNVEAYKMYTDASATFAEARDAVKAETEFNRQLGKTEAAEAESTHGTVQGMVWVLLLVSVMGGSTFVFFIVRSTNRGLLKAVTDLAEGADQVAHAAAQVATSSQSLAQGSSEQAASLEETSASTEEITAMTRKNAENSQSAAAVMGTVDQQVRQGNSTLDEMLASMNEIKSSSEKISKIIRVIDEIAFQTNILALNAAVEAARAGEAGMGFAVVADEVRNLAQRSAQAAKDTSALIEESVSKSGQGSTNLEKVAEVIHSITDSSSKVKILVDEVNLGSQEQARGIEQISKAVAQMDQVTQSTAASAEESASASEQLSAQAQTLKDIVRELRVLAGNRDGGNGSLAHPAPARTASPRASIPKPQPRGPKPAPAQPMFASVPLPAEDNFLEM